MRRPPPPPSILGASNALALRGGEWFEVTGGSWKPDSAGLSITKFRVHEQWLTYFRGHPEQYKAGWDRYSFQYTGFTTRDGLRRLIQVNAFCVDDVETLYGEFNYSREWVQPFRGGSCFFGAVFDPMMKAVTSFEMRETK